MAASFATRVILDFHTSKPLMGHGQGGRVQTPSNDLGLLPARCLGLKIQLLPRELMSFASFKFHLA